MSERKRILAKVLDLRKEDRIWVTKQLARRFFLDRIASKLGGRIAF